MTRIATRNVRKQEKPEPLLPRIPSAEQITAAVERQLPPLTNFPVKIPFPPADAYPQISPQDARALCREEAFRVRELADLPDSGMIW